MTAITPAVIDIVEPPKPLSRRLYEFGRRNPTVVIGSSLLLAMVFMAIFAPLFAPGDPLSLAPSRRLRPPQEAYWFGTDMFGRDVYTRTIYGARISLIVGISVAILSTVVGLFIGLLAGYVRMVDAIVMRIMDGLMSIPGILLAIAMMALTKASVENVIIAIMIPEIPRVVRLVRGVVLQIREQPYIEAALSIGTRFHRILLKHILPNIMAPLIVQATYICAAAVLIEAGLSFLGAGTPPNIPSWGNIMAEGRTFFQIAFWIILFPGLFLSVTVLAINLLGDGLRDALDPRLARRM
jgi:peptide/nickel transport system permease protein